MNNETLVEALRVNRVKIHKKFAYKACHGGCVAGLRPLYDKILEAMTDILTEAFNSATGLTPGVRKALKKLSSLLVTVSEKENASAYDKLAASADVIISEVKISLNREGNSTMKNEILKQIGCYREGISVVMSMELAPERDDILRECLAKMDELEAALGNVIDITGTDAQKCALEIQSTLAECGNLIATSMHNGRTPAILDKAIRQAGAWATIRVAKKRGLFGIRLPADAPAEISFDEKNDPLAQVAQSRKYLEDINNFRGNLTVFKERVARQYDTAKESETVQNLQAELVRLQAQAQNLGDQYNNGMISVTELDDRLCEIENAQERTRDRIETMQSAVTNKRDAYGSYEDVFYVLGELLTTIEEYAGIDPEVIAALGEEIDFNALTALMRGNASLEEEQSVRALEELTVFITRKREEGTKAFAEKMRERARARREARNAERAAEREARRAASPTKQSEADKESVLARLARLSGQRVGQPQPQPADKPQNKPEDALQNPEQGTQNPVGGFQV